MTYRIVNTDNFGSDYPDEKFVGDEYTDKEEAETKADEMKRQLSRTLTALLQGR